MNFEIDLTPLYALGDLPPLLIFWKIFLYGGWLIFLLVFLRGAWHFWLFYIRGKFAQTIQYILLAIDIPRENQQGPEAVERLFAHLAGARSKGTKFEQYFKGYFQLSFSFELISIDGQIQFLIRTPVRFRDLVEAAVYTAYPEAEITEVEDYTEAAPDIFPNEEYDCWAADLVLYNKDPYPIRTYPSFEHSLSKELKDPLTDLLEIMSKMQSGEQIWLQLIITPIDASWKIEGEKLVKKLMMGIEITPTKTTLDKIIEFPLNILQQIGELIFLPSASPTEGKEKRTTPLSPGEYRVIEAIQNKISKIAFAVKFRVVYLGEKEVFDKARGVTGVLGAISQFNTLDMNGFKPDDRAKTSRPMFFGQKRLAAMQNRLIRAYKQRNSFVGGRTCILNIEELASLYHFPVSSITRVPLIKKTGSRRGEPPFGLPTV
ncbi:MAG: hypothetical protein ACP5IX_00920 [Patescibacteria group bacterium]